MKHTLVFVSQDHIYRCIHFSSSLLKPLGGNALSRYTLFHIYKNLLYKNFGLEKGQNFTNENAKNVLSITFFSFVLSARRAFTILNVIGLL